MASMARADVLYCQPNEGNEFSIESGGTFVIDADCGASAIVTPPSHGTLTNTGPGTWTYTATGGYSGTDTFVASVTSSIGGSGPQGNFGGGGGNETITLDVAPSAPTTSNASASTAFNAAATIDLTTHISGQGVSGVNLAAGPSHGTVSFNGEVATYLPANNYQGSDSFQYTASNGAGASNASTVTVTVNPPPLPTTASVSVGTPYNTARSIDVSASIAGADITAVAVASPPAHGTATVNGEVVTYTPSSAYYGGADSFTYTATNPGGPSTPATVTVTVGSPPAPTAAAVNAGTAYNTATPIGLNASITGVAIASVMVASQPAHGTATVNGEVVTYTPSTIYYGGPDSFTYTATNPGGTSTPATVTVTVAAPPGPTATARTAGTAYGAAATIDLSGSVTGVDITAVTVASPPAHGTATVNGRSVTYTPSAAFYGGTDSFTYTATNPGGTSAPATVTVTVAAPAAPTVAGKATGTPYGTATTINLSDVIAGPGITAVTIASAPSHGTATVSGQAVTYTPAAAFSGGPDTFTYTATNPGGTSAPATVTVTVQRPGTPTAAAVSGGTPYGTATTLDLSGSITGAGITAVGLASAPAHGTATISGRTVTYTPAAAFYGGTDSLTYTATNAGGTSAPATITITVATPGAPVAAAKAVGTPYNTAATIDLSGSIAGTSVSIVTVTAPLHGTTTASGESVTYTPAPAFTGIDTFTYTATNPGGTSVPAAVTVTVGAPMIPVAAAKAVSGIADAAATIDLSGSITGVNVTAIAVPTPPAHGSAKVDGLTVVYTPAAGFAGVDTFTYAATNAWGTSAPAAVTVTIARPSLAFAPASGNLTAGQVGTPYSVQIAASGGTAPYTYGLTRGALPTGLSIAPGTGAISGTPASAVTASFTIAAKDAHGATGTAAYTLTIAAPQIVVPSIDMTVAAVGATTVNLTSGATGGPFTGANLLSLSPPSAGNALITLGDTASLSGDVMASLIQSGNYKLRFTPAAAFTGTAIATFTISNATGTSAPATVTFTVAPRSDPSRDQDVVGLVNAQAEAAKRFAATQVFNFNDRLEALHDATCLVNTWGLGVSDSRGATPDNAHLDPLPDRDPNPLTHTPGGTAGRESRDAAGGAGGKDRCSRFAGGALAFWAGGFVNFGSTTLSGGGGYDHTTTGTSAGVDYRVDPALTLGLGFGFGSDQTRIGSDGTRSTGDAYDVATYATYHLTPSIFVDALVGYGRLGFESRRYLTETGGFGLGRRDGDQVFGSVTGGYEVRRDGLLVSPYARLTGSRSVLDAFTEYGGTWADLHYGAQRVASVTSFLGLRTSYRVSTAWGAIVPELRLEYGHDFAGSSSVALSYADLQGGQVYDLKTQGSTANFMTLGLRTRLDLDDDKSLDFEYRTSFFQERTMPQQLRLGLDKRF